MKISCVLVLGLTGLNTAAAAVAVVNSHTQSMARAEPAYDPATDIFFDPQVEAALLDVASEVINKGGMARRDEGGPPTVTDADVEKAIRHMADKAPEGRREATLARLNTPEGKSFVKSMLIYFANGANIDKKAKAGPK